MWVGEGTQRDCLYSREMCCHILPLPECGSTSVPAWLVSAADALYRDVSLQVPPLWPEAKGASVQHLGPGTSVCAWSSLHADSPRDRVDMGGCRGAFSISCGAGCRSVQLARWLMLGEFHKGCLSL